jgi:transcription initiation factor IIE alpha subunit
MTHKTVEEMVEEFEKKFVNTEINIDGGIAYKEWAYKQDAEEAIGWLRTTLTTAITEAEERACLKGERNRIIEQLREEVGKEAEERGYEIGYNQARFDIELDIPFTRTQEFKEAVDKIGTKDTPPTTSTHPCIECGEAVEEGEKQCVDCRTVTS